MSNNKQSSVEWLAKSYVDLLTELNDDKISLKEFEIKYIEILEQAKAMHKQEIVWAHGVKMKGVNNHKCVSGEQYYNETFGSNNK